jgi:hypothetical protein
MTFTHDLAREHALRRLDAIADACTTPDPVHLRGSQSCPPSGTAWAAGALPGPHGRSARPMPQHGSRWYTETQDEEWWGDA